MRVIWGDSISITRYSAIQVPKTHLKQTSKIRGHGQMLISMSVSTDPTYGSLNTDQYFINILFHHALVAWWNGSWFYIQVDAVMRNQILCETLNKLSVMFSYSTWIQKLVEWIHGREFILKICHTWFWIRRRFKDGVQTPNRVTAIFITNINWFRSNFRRK